MIVSKEERNSLLKEQNYSNGIETFLLELRPPREFKRYFQTPFYIYNFEDCEDLKDRNLLPLFEYHEEVYALDLLNKEYVSFVLESPESLTIYKNIYSAFLYIFTLYAWEHGGEDKEAREVIEFSDAIDFPYWEKLRDMMNGIYVDGDLEKLKHKLESEPDTDTGPN